mmetsp:Transcript_2810/g.7878  ORF Transcript_2810/g.7878 Transcript_2810/m.7878 type:complete len:347 (+) Transcript_2810:814-1854(+)
MAATYSPMQVDEEDATDPLSPMQIHEDEGAMDPLSAILFAQEGGLRFYPGYQTALQEIRQGRKRSCWMWFIFPSLEGVRQHRMPDMLLPNFDAVVAYLQHDTLGPRLLVITDASLTQVTASHRLVPSVSLFGGQLDSTKVHESCTMFAVAAVAIGHENALLLFVRFIRRCFRVPNPTVLRVLREESRTSSSVDQFFKMEHWIQRLEENIASIQQEKEPEAKPNKLLNDAQLVKRPLKMNDLILNQNPKEQREAYRTKESQKFAATSHAWMQTDSNEAQREPLFAMESSHGNEPEHKSFRAMEPAHGNEPEHKSLLVVEDSDGNEPTLLGSFVQKFLAVFKNFWRRD